MHVLPLFTVMHITVFNAEEKVLLVGEGNFSFSVDLANLLPLDITATCLDPQLSSEDAKSNVLKLCEKGVRVFLGVDATKLVEHPIIGCERFDKVVFNFPHIGGKMKLGANRQLLKQFLGSAVNALGRGGRVVVSLCRGQGGTPADDPPRAWGDTWQLVEMAAHADLLLEDVHPFQRQPFPHYSCVGYRGRDTSFHLDGALVHVLRPAGSLLPLWPHPSAPPPGSPVHYLCRQLKDFLRLRYGIAEVVLPSPASVFTCLPSQLRTMLLLWSRENPRLLVAEALVLGSCRHNFSLPPASLQVLFVGEDASCGCADFIQHVVRLFRKDESCLVSCESSACSEFLGIRCSQGDMKLDIYVVTEKNSGHKSLVSEECGVDIDGCNMRVGIVHMDKLAELMFEVVNWRELWAEGADVHIKDSIPCLKRACLYSRPHVFDVTFRETDTFTVEHFYDVLWELAGDIITGVTLLNTYESLEGWRSRCYRITYQSFSKALSREKAIMVHHHHVGAGLVDKLGVTIF